MEGILFDTAVFSSPIAFLCGVAILAVAVAAILLGSMADAERAGRTLYWAEWPLPESGTEVPPKVEKVRRAA